uniref:C3H1-type domain-containing protein n=1 Tax=Clastoptera arizonana TaxID=38151 RepID=A0A1B6CCB4_9HEMI
MTFKLSQQGTSLVRTNTHTTRTRLIQAKQRSIALLTNKFKKNNQLCLIFNQFGRCAGKDNGTCCKIHNLQNISICQKFVQGKCQNSSCLLSHEISPEKMPTCYHYLAGNCVRDNCPYLHVKVNSHAPVCPAFLDGFCIDGENCKKRHTNICPEFEREGVCSKGKYCPHPHQKKRKIPKNKKKEVETNNDEIKSYQEVSTFRYFDQNQHQEKQGENKTNEYYMNSNISTNDEESVKVFSKRPNLGVLPAFIPLNFD